MDIRLSTDCVGARIRADDWHETVLSVFGKCDLVHTGHASTQFELVTRRTGDIALVNSSGNSFHVRRAAWHINGDRRDGLAVNFLRRGTALTEQDDRRIRRRPGEIVISDLARPVAETKETDHEILGFMIDRERLERVLGSAKRFTALPIDETVGSVPITAFLISLYDNAERLPPEVVAEMAGVGVELVMNGLARRLAMERTLPQSAAFLLHKAQAFVAANLADPDLTPATIAAVLGISVRHLQGLFHRRQTTPSELIWSTRLARARQRLASPAFATVSVAEVAYGCGFADQGHFSRRFKAEYGLSPRDWRRRFLVGGEKADAQ